MSQKVRCFPVLVPVSVLMACSAPALPAAPSQAAQQSGRIVVLGDSLSVTPSRDESFPSVLQKRIDADGLRWTVVNAGVSGDTTAGGRRRFESAVSGGADVLVLALGANDGLRGVPLESVEQNLASIIEQAQARGMRVLLCGMETLPVRGWEYTVGFHELFPRLARRYSVPLVPFLLQGVALLSDMNGPDGIHPNAAGATRIAETIWPYLRPMLEPGRIAA